MFALRDVMKTASPTGAISDFLAVYRQAGKNRWWIAITAACITSGLFWSLTHESWKRPRALPQVFYITTFAPDRTEAESLAFRKARQAEREAREAAYAAADAEGRRLYKQLGAATGMDVEAIEQRAEAERAAAAAAQKAKIDAILKQNAAGSGAVGKP
jgi:hypothetical protein